MAVLELNDPTVLALNASKSGSSNLLRSNGAQKPIGEQASNSVDKSTTCNLHVDLVHQNDADAAEPAHAAARPLLIARSLLVQCTPGRSM